MSSIINTNSLSLLTQNNLLKSQSSLTTAIQRLSSGLRINSAKDDAAGQAIANRFTSSIKGLAQSQRNANDGISLAQTTEGALNEINNNLQRVRELTVQSANGSNSKSDLDSIQSEITQRMAEIDRTSQQTDFNGTKVLGSAAATLKIQVGANDGETIDIGLKTINTSTLGVASFNINGTGTANTAATKNDLALNAGWTQGTAGTVGYTTGSAFTAGTADAVTGAVQYTQTVGKVTTAAAAAYDVAYTAATRANVFAAVANNGTVALNGSAAKLDNFKYVSTTSSYDTTTAATVGSTTAGTAVPVSGAPAGGVASYLVPTGTAQTSATVTIGTKVQQIKVDSTGNVKDDAGNQLYLDTTGNLTQNNFGGLTAANIGKGDTGDLLRSMSEATGATYANLASTTAGGTITATGGSINITQPSGSIVNLNITAQSTVADGLATSVETNNQTWAVTQKLTAADMQSKSAAAATTVVDTLGTSVAATTYTINGTTGAVTDGAGTPNAVYLSDAGASPANTLTTATKRTVAAVAEVVTPQTSVVYTLQTNGAVMDNAGNRVYKDSDTTNVKGFTLTDRSGATSTPDAMKVIDAALATVDKLRSSLGAVQNRFDSVISNLGSTITNLSASRSRIEDADYATEVSNMTRAQILQQAGTSVLAKANQSTQGVMSLLQ